MALKFYENKTRDVCFDCRKGLCQGHLPAKKSLFSSEWNQNKRSHMAYIPLFCDKICSNEVVKCLLFTLQMSLITKHSSKIFLVLSNIWQLKHVMIKHAHTHFTKYEDKVEIRGNLGYIWWNIPSPYIYNIILTGVGGGVKGR